jgi:hypothetical protein
MELFRIIKLKKLASPRNIVHKITELCGGGNFHYHPKDLVLISLVATRSSSCVSLYLLTNVEKLLETNLTIESSGCGIGEIAGELPTNVAAAKHNKLII